MNAEQVVDNFSVPLIPIAVIVGVLAIVGVFLLKNRWGIYLGWIPSFIALVFGIVMAINQDYVLISIFAVYFLSYAVSVIIKLASDKAKSKRIDSLKKEFDRMNIDDLD